MVDRGVGDRLLQRTVARSGVVLRIELHSVNGVRAGRLRCLQDARSESAELVDIHVEAIAEAIREAIGSDRPAKPAQPARLEQRERLDT